MRVRWVVSKPSIILSASVWIHALMTMLTKKKAEVSFTQRSISRVTGWITPTLARPPGLPTICSLQARLKPSAQPANTAGALCKQAAGQWQHRLLASPAPCSFSLSSEDFLDGSGLSCKVSAGVDGSAFIVPETESFSAGKSTLLCTAGDTAV